MARTIDLYLGFLLKGGIQPHFTETFGFLLKTTETFGFLLKTTETFGFLLKTTETFGFLLKHLLKRFSTETKNYRNIRFSTERGYSTTF